MSAEACVVQPAPPRIANGRLAPASSALRDSTSAPAGLACTTRNGGASAASDSSDSMSSGSASTTGPGRPAHVTV